MVLCIPFYFPISNVYYCSYFCFLFVTDFSAFLSFVNRVDKCFVLIRSDFILSEGGLFQNLFILPEDNPNNKLAYSFIFQVVLLIFNYS